MGIAANENKEEYRPPSSCMFMLRQYLLGYNNFYSTLVERVTFAGMCRSFRRVFFFVVIFFCHAVLSVI